jgi:hypothetical protein
MATRRILIHPKDKTFSRLLGEIKEGIINNNRELIDSAKAEFAEADISLSYNREKKIIRVLQEGSAPIDFSL